MIVVIIAGGSGTRLWPLSTPEYPKHLLKLSGDESLLQSAYGRAKKLTNDVYVVTEFGHAHHVREQLPSLGDDAFIIEPGRRGTAGCIVAGLHHLQSRHDHDEPVAFIHADHAIRDIDGFTYSFKVAAKVSSEKARLTLIGIEPTYPSIGLGYIQKADVLRDNGLVYEVAGFKEKPEFEVARKYMQSGRYLWNCGYFVAPISVFVRDFEEFSPQWKQYYDQLLQTKDEQSYKDTYLSFESNAIDYALLEHNNKLQVVPASFDWMDIGSFKDLHEVSDADEAGNHFRGDGVHVHEVENAYIRNEEQKPIAVIGLDNVVVVNTPNGLLVARKDLSQKVGDIAKKIQE
jgi:mannose-1-phosphate guanylyltransferase/mannose-6-phosphate isomerase